MNFHIFVAIITCVFYVFLRIYKSNVLEKENTKNKVTSNLLYVLFLPAILYLTNFIYYTNTIREIKNDINIGEQKGVGGGVFSEDLLSIPYPESSFRSSNLN
jgi:hypothetical protein